MPVSSHHVPLDTAKAWAKRLARFSREHQTTPTLKLHQAQAAVADMLGFNDWHALTQHLGAVAELLPPPSLATNPTSYTRDELTAFWEKTLSSDDSTDIHFEKRSDTLRVRVRQNGDFQHEWETTSNDALETLLALADAPETQQELFGDTDYASGTWIPLSKNLRYRLRYQALPVYPSGRDIVVLREALRPHPISSKWFPQHQKTLKEHLYPGPGLIVVAGTTSSGRTTFAHHLMTMARQIHAQPNPKTLVFSDSPCQALSPLEATVIRQTGPGDSADSVLGWIEKGLDFFLIDEVRTLEHMKLAAAAVQRGALVFITLHARTERMVLERLMDFSQQKTQAESLAKEIFLRLSTYVKLLPMACTKCSTGAAIHPGTSVLCDRCKGRGTKGRTLQAQAARWEGNQFHDLWPQWEQVRQLLAEGNVSREDVETLLGPAPLEHDATEENRFLETTPFVHNGQM